VIDDSLAVLEDIYEFDFIVTSGAEPDAEFAQPCALLEI